MEEFAEHYKYLALSGATFLEGETAILVASSLIPAGVFDAPQAVFFGFLGSFLSDWLYYGIGRWNGRSFIESRPKLMQRFAPIELFLSSHQTALLLCYRFLYGFRIILPLWFGMSGVSFRKFLTYSVVSGLSWASLVSSAGYTAGKFFGLSPEVFRDNILIIVLTFASIGLLLGLTIQRVASRYMSHS